MDLSVYIPLGILGLARWICWLIRRLPATLYLPYRSQHHEPLAVVVPVYQEDPDIFRIALESWLANDVDEVICVIDVTDRPCREVAAAYQGQRRESPRQPRVTVITTTAPGKRPALVTGWRAATTPLVALVDSDTVWAPDVAERVCEPFADPRIGGVGTRQNVWRPSGLWQRITDMYLDYRYFDENAAQTRMGRAVSCLSGRTAVYRRELLLHHEKEFLEETFLGVPCNSGDDKRLTTLILEAGWSTYMQRSARVWSTFPPDARTFFRQRLRWARNTWRSDLRALGRGWVFRYPFLAFSMVDKAVSSFTLLLSPSYMVLALLRADWTVALLLAAWWLVSRSAKVLPHLRRNPKSVLLVPAYVLISFAMAAVKLYALGTIRRQRWLTRSVAVVDGQVVRTGERVA
ncbi:MAG: glycosyltransferase [Actinomycetota bacterium]|nr:glycosyltransferase [Actinomycetota bacterium]